MATIEDLADMISELIVLVKQQQEETRQFVLTMNRMQDELANHEIRIKRLENKAGE